MKGGKAQSGGEWSRCAHREREKSGRQAVKQTEKMGEGLLAAVCSARPLCGRLCALLAEPCTARICRKRHPCVVKDEQKAAPCGWSSCARRMEALRQAAKKTAPLILPAGEDAGACSRFRQIAEIRSYSARRRGRRSRASVREGQVRVTCFFSAPERRAVIFSA